MDHRKPMLWVGGSLFILAILCVPIGLLLRENRDSPGRTQQGTTAVKRFPPVVTDSWTHRNLANHLKESGIQVELQQVSEANAIFSDLKTGGRIAVILAHDHQTAVRAGRRGGSEWVAFFVVGPFFVGAANEGADAEFCRRAKAAFE